MNITEYLQQALDIAETLVEGLDYQDATLALQCFAEVGEALLPYRDEIKLHVIEHIATTIKSAESLTLRSSNPNT